MMVSIPGSSFNLIVTARFTGLVMQAIGLARTAKPGQPTKSKDRTAESSDEKNTTSEERQSVISEIASYLPDVKRGVET
jgi:hypothetical protein